MILCIVEHTFDCFSLYWYRVYTNKEARPINTRDHNSVSGDGASVTDFVVPTFSSSSSIHPNATILSFHIHHVEAKFFKFRKCHGKHKISEKSKTLKKHFVFKVTRKISRKHSVTCDIFHSVMCDLWYVTLCHMSHYFLEIL